MSQNGREAEVEAALLREIARLLNEPVTELDSARSLSELGLDSVGYCTVSAFIQKKFGIAVRPEKLFEFSSVERTAAHVAELSGECLPASPHAAPTWQDLPPASTDQGPLSVTASAYSDRDVAVIGIALKLPGAEDPEQYWNLIERGASQIREFPAERTPAKDHDARPAFLKGGFVEQVAAFDAPFFGISPREAVPMDPQQRLFLECAWHTFENAGYEVARLSASNTAVFVGASSFDYYELLLQSQTARTTHIGTGVSHAVLANRVSQYFNLKGPSEAIDTACSSGLVALWRGVEAVRRGESELALIGAVNVLASRSPFQVFADAGMLSPEGACLPFDARAAGYVRGEGVASVLLKRAADAVRDGDRIWAVIKGGAVRHSGKTNSLTAPNPDAQADVIVAAVTDAGVDPTSIGYVEAHGTGTALGDPIEINGLKRAFHRLHAERGRSETTPHFSVGSVKALIGHLEAAAGLAGLIKAVLALVHRTLPGNPHLTAVNPHIQLGDACFGFLPEPRLWVDPPLSEPRRAGVSSFGFGGVNAHVVLEEARPPAPRPPAPSRARLFLLSAKTVEALVALTSSLDKALSSRRFTDEAEEQTYLADLSFTLRGATSLPHRLALIATTVPELLQKLAGPREGAREVFSGVARAGQGVPMDLFSSEAELEQHLQTLATSGDLARLAALWVRGCRVEWQKLLPRATEARVSVPSYPFARESFWVRFAESDAAATAPARYCLYEPAWEERPLGDDPEPRSAEGGIVVLASGPEGQRVAELIGRTRRVIIASLDTNATAKAVAAEGQNLSGILDLTALDGSVEQRSLRARERMERLRESIGALLKRGERLTVLQVTLGLQQLDEESPPTTLAGAQEAGFYKNLWAEYQRCRSKTLDFAPGSFSAEVAATLIAREFQVHDGPSELGYAGGRRMARVMRHVLIPPPRVTAERGEVALITGGSGEIGLALAADLVARGFRALLLTGRRELAPERRQRIEALTRQGVTIAFYRGDLCDETAFGEAVARFRATHGAITHVYHCAGAMSRSAPAFFQKTAGSMAEVAEPKVDALWVLHRLMESAPPRVFVLFSSISAAAPRLAAGLLDYAAANQFLDRFAEYQRTHGHHYYRSVQWTRWRQLGLARDAREKSGAGLALAPEHCFEALHHIAAADELPPVVCVAAAGDTALEAHALERPAVLEGARRATTVAFLENAQDQDDGVRRRVRAILAKELEIQESKLDDHASFEDLGLDSIVLIGVVVRLEQWLGAKVDPSELIQCNSIAAVARHLARAHGVAPLVLPTEPVEKMPEPPTASAPTAPAATSAPFRVAVIGVACRFPGAPDKETFWRNLVAGRDSVSTVPPSRWDSQALYVERHQPGKTVSQWGGFIEGIERVNPALFGLRPEDAADLDPLIRLFTETSLAAVVDSPYDRAALSGRRVGVFAGARGSRYAERIASPGKHSVTGVGQNFIAAFVSHLLDLRGPSLVLDSACSSSLAAVHLACQSLQSGDSELAIAGGVDLLLDEKPYLFLSAAHALSPDGRCRTFDENANGFVPGEGVGCVLLKPLERALADGDHVYAVIDGSAINNDGHTLGITTPGVEGQMDVIERALEKAAASPSTISYVETHGTGTMIGDPIELRALSRVFAKDPPQSCALGSVKTNLGHLLSAAGIASFIKVTLALHHQTLPPTLHCDRINPRFEFERTPFSPLRQTRPWAPEAGVRRAGVSAFGFGKTNVHLILSERPAATRRPMDLETAPPAVADADKIYSWHPPNPGTFQPSSGLLGLEALTFESLEEA